MVKRIQCTVISSVPLGKTTDASHHPRNSKDKSAAHPADKPDRIDETIVEDIRVNSVGQVSWLNIASALIDDSEAGHNLDCYA